MTGLQSLEARSALGGIFAVASFFAASSKRIHRIDRKTFDRAVYAAFLISRFGLYLLAFFILHLAVRGDVPTFYVLPGQAVLHHMMPYRDFPSSYAPAHAYIDAALLLVWNSPLVILLFAIVAECFILPVWLRVARLIVPESTARIAAVLYITSAISVQFVTIDGQDTVILAVLLGLALLALARHRDSLSGALIALSAVLIKFLSLLFAPVFFLISPRRFRWTAAFFVVLIAGYGSFALGHMPVLFPFYFEHTDRSASNLPYLLEGLFNLTPPERLEDIVMALALLFVLALLARVGMRRLNSTAAARAITFGCPALLLTLLIFSRKSWPPYVMLTLFPLCLLLGQGERFRLRLACFAVFNVVAVIAHSFWATVFQQFIASEFHQALRQHIPAAYLLLFLQTALIVGYFWLVRESIAAFLQTSRALPETAAAS